MAGEGTTTLGDISRSTNVYLNKDFIEAGEPQLLTEMFGAVCNVPKGEGVTANWVQYLPFDATPNYLVEGVTPTPKKMANRKVEATLKQLGDTVEISDVVEDTHTDPALQEATRLMGRQAGEMLELHRLGYMKSGTCVIYANGDMRSAVNTVFNDTHCRLVVRSLERARAKKITMINRSTASYGTKSVPQAYIAFVHPDARGDIEALKDFKPVEDYGQLTPYPSEIGAKGQIRFLANDLLTPYADSGGNPSPGGALPDVLSTGGVQADVYPMLVFGEKAYGIVAHKLYKAKNLDGKTVNSTPVNVYVHSPGKASKSDPLGQRGIAGWKTWSAGALLTEPWLWRVEVACSK